jgi:hypothetical protein
MTEREEILVPPTCGRCGIFVGMVLKSEGDIATQEKSLVGFCEWREGLVFGWETPPSNCGCIDASFVRGISHEVTKRGLGEKKIEEIERRLETVMLRRAGFGEAVDKDL